jgi:hypothetical protein
MTKFKPTTSNADDDQSHLYDALNALDVWASLATQDNVSGEAHQQGRYYDLLASFISDHHQCSPDARYKCKDDACTATVTRDAKTLQEAGDPYCPACDSDMIAS